MRRRVESAVLSEEPTSAPVVPNEGVAVSSRATKKTDRLANIDRLRLLALIEIIVFHTTQRAGEAVHVFGGVGLPIFLLFTVALNARPRASESGAGFIRRKAAMFLIPWAAWSIVYAVCNTVAPLARGAEPFKWFRPEMIVVGTQTHLWYLIFALIASLAAMAGYRLTSKFHDMAVVVGGAVLACLLVMVEQFVQVKESWAADWLVAVPAIPLGLALGRCIHAPTGRERIRRVLILALIVGPAMAVLDQTQMGYSAGRFALAIIPITLVVLWPGRPDRMTTELTRLRLGVYLVHMLIIGGLHFVSEEASGGVLRPIVVIVGSFVLAWAITRTPLCWMVQPNVLRAKLRPAVDRDQSAAGDAVGG